MSIKIKSFTKEQLAVGLTARNGIYDFMGVIEIPVEALNTPVKQRKVVSDQSVEEDVTYEPVSVRDCMMVLFEDDVIAIVSTEEEIKPGRYMNASPEWLLHLADVFGVESILTHSDGEERLRYKRVEKRYNALTVDQKGNFNIRFTIAMGENYISVVPAIDQNIDLADRLIAEEEMHAAERKEIEQLLYDMTVEEKKQICRDYEISGYSALNESELVTLLINSWGLNVLQYNDFFVTKEA